MGQTIVFRRLSTGEAGLVAQELFGPGGVAEWVDVEQPRVNNPRADLLSVVLKGEEQHDAANIFVIVSGIRGIEDDVTERINMIDIMENKIIGPAIRNGLAQGERNVVVRLLTWKFGQLPGAITEKLQNASESDLLVWEQRLLNANTLDEIFHV